MESFTLYQVNEYIRRVIALNFREPIWIDAEISQCKESRGNYYIDLIDKDEITLQVNANAQANLWQSSFRFIKRKIGDVIYELLQEGRSVRLKCKVEFHERYGMKLVVDDIDPNYTFGQIELKRQEIINQLKEEKLFDLNRSIELPIICQNIALITSSEAAGYKDFISHLNANPYGYQFNINIYESSVQGLKVESETINAIDNLLRKSQGTYDAVIILRGGGSKLDLSAYDNYNIAARIARAPLPFIIGIGHEIDQSIVDMISKSSLKTPTAVADFLIEQMLHFESSLINQLQVISTLSERILNSSFNRLNILSEQLRSLSERILYREVQTLELTNYRITDYVKKLVSAEQASLDIMMAKINGNDPEIILNKGYTYIMSDGKSVKKASVLKSGQKVQIMFADDKKTAQIK